MVILATVVGDTVVKMDFSSKHLPYNKAESDANEDVVNNPVMHLDFLANACQRT